MPDELLSVDFDDIYDALLNNDNPMRDEEECMEFLRAADDSRVRAWMDRISTDGDVLSDIKSIIAYYLEENGE